MTNLPKGFLKNPVNLFAFGFGSGCVPKAPGTFGTVVGVLLYLSFQHLSLWAYLSIIIASFIVGIWICGHASKVLGVHDHGGIVWDEFVGFWITMIAAPPGCIWIVIGFLLFRIFDIWKPWPIKAADRKIGGGFGIMFDDVLAGVYALICLQALNYAFLS